MARSVGCGSLFDEFVDDEEFVVVVLDDCVSWLLLSSDVPGVSHSTPACVAWTSDSLCEPRYSLCNRSYRINFLLTHDWWLVQSN